MRIPLQISIEMDAFLVLFSVEKETPFQSKCAVSTCLFPRLFPRRFLTAALLLRACDVLILHELCVENHEFSALAWAHSETTQQSA